ncbi:MAG TPA: hypothetical protein VI072_16955 [Polyangiaceae bacterium]
MRRLFELCALGLVLQGCARGPNVATDQLPLRRVVVYRNGVGYFERSGHVDADQVKFKVRQRMIGDFLATLAIVEHGGSSVRSASFPLEIEQLQSQPTPPEPDPRPGRGVPVPPPAPSVPDSEKMRDVILYMDGKEHDLAIGYVSETPVWRPSYRVVVHENGAADLQAWGIVQNLSGVDWNGVKLSLVAGAPLAFESTLGDPVVPSRPIVTDNGEVIAAVPTGETSLREDASQGVDIIAPSAPSPPPAAEAAADEADSDEESMREEVATGAGGAMRPSKKSAGPAASRVASAPAPRPAPGSPADGQATATERRRYALEAARQAGLSAPRKMSALAAVAVEAGTTRYEIPGSITVPNESATMVLLLSRRVPGEAVFLFAPDGGVPDSASHPFRVVRFTNATSGLLERGPIAVFEKGSFLGQGILASLPPRATATVPFALERSLAVDSERRYEQQGARLVRIEAGELFIERDNVIKTLYKIRNGSDQRAKLVVKHLRQPGSRLFRPPVGTEDNTGTGSALVPLEVRAHARAELTVDERQSGEQREDWLSPLADEAVKSYLADPRRDAEVAGKLSQAWQVRQTLRRALDEQAKFTDEQGELEKAARETRLSLQAIEKNAQAADLRARLTRRLQEVTARLEQITKRLIELKLAINEQQVRFRDAVRDVRLLKAPPPQD